MLYGDEIFDSDETNSIHKSDATCTTFIDRIVGYIYKFTSIHLLHISKFI